MIGQFGYPDGPLLDDPGRYPAVNGSKDGSGPDQGTYNSWARAHGGGGHPVVADNPPFLYGPNFTSVPNLADVDKNLKAHGINP